MREWSSLSLGGEHNMWFSSSHTEISSQWLFSRRMCACEQLNIPAIQNSQFFVLPIGTDAPEYLPLFLGMLLPLVDSKEKKRNSVKDARAGREEKKSFASWNCSSHFHSAANKAKSCCAVSKRARHWDRKMKMEKQQPASEEKNLISLEHELGLVCHLVNNVMWMPTVLSANWSLS